MARLHLFEWEDQPWFPRALRDFITDHLVVHMSRAFAPAVPTLADAMRTTGETAIVDLCSGSGGPLPALLPALRERVGASVTVTLTDLYPNTDAMERLRRDSGGAIGYRGEPTSALACPSSLRGFRTVFTALHHFRPESVRRILADAADNRVPIAAFEAQERNLRSLALVPLVVFLGAFLWTPFLQGRSVRRLLLTYVVPVAPLCFAWDAAVSCLRSYRPDELRSLAADIGAQDYRWQVGQIRAGSPLGAYRITYLVGLPGR